METGKYGRKVRTSCWCGNTAHVVLACTLRLESPKDTSLGIAIIIWTEKTESRRLSKP